MLQNTYYKAIIPLCFVIIIDAMSWGIVIPCLGPIILKSATGMISSETSIETRNILFSMSLGLPMFFMFFGAPILGNLSDSIGRKKTLLIALIGMTLSCLLSALGVIFASITMLLIGRCVLGFVDSSEAIAKAAITDISTEKSKALHLNLMSFCGTFGFLFAPILGGFLSDHHISHFFTYTTPFLVSALLAVINAIVLWFLFEETFTPKTKKPFKLLASLKHLISAFTDKRIRILSLIFFCMQFAWGGYFQTISIVLIENFQYTTQQVGIFLTCIALSLAFVWSLFIRIMVDFFETKTIVRFGMFLLILGNLIVALTSNEKLIWLSIIPATFGVGFCYNTVLFLFSDAVEKESQGRIMGIATALFAISWLLASLISGYFSAKHPQFPYWILTVVSAVGFFFAVLPVRREKHVN